MQLRGRLLKQDGPSSLQSLLSDVSGLSFEPEVEGGDGTSRKARVPFIVIFDQQHYRSPPLRWYAAYLFAADGSAVYLSLSLGSPPQEDGNKSAICPGFPSGVCPGRVRSSNWEGDERVSAEMALNDPGRVGPFFEQGSVAAYRYSSEAIPEDEKLRVDLRSDAQDA